MNDSLLLNVASWLPRSRANGPGTRMVLWLQGCPFRCLGCQNPDFLPFTVNKILTVEQVWQVFQQIPELDGISFSGGEPFAQAVALAQLALRVQEAGKTVLCWSGYRLEQLQSGKVKGSTEFLSHIDLLIDGLFMPEKVGNGVLRGSENQQLHFLSGHITEADLKDIPRQEWVVNSEIVTYTGFPVDFGIDIG